MHEDTYRKDFTVTSYEVNPVGRARLTTIANYLQETAYQHASRLQLGYHHLAEKNLAWILSRLRIRVNRYPTWDTGLTVETWPRGLEKLFALRDFRITDDAGKLIAEAATCWLMVDTQSHRPVRIPADFIAFETRTDAVFDRTPGKIRIPGQMETVHKRRAAYSDLDVVGHVNNVKYIGWCCDVLELKVLLEKGIRDFAINFTGEATAGQEVELQACREVPAGQFISGINHSTGKECFRAELSLQP